MLLRWWSLHTYQCSDACPIHGNDQIIILLNMFHCACLIALKALFTYPYPGRMSNREDSERWTTVSNSFLKWKDIVLIEYLYISNPCCRPRRSVKKETRTTQEFYPEISPILFPCKIHVYHERWVSDAELYTVLLCQTIWVKRRTRTYCDAPMPLF